MTAMVLPQLLIFCALAFGTLVGLPVAPFYLAAGAAAGLWSLLWIAPALALHMALSFLLAHSVVRPTLNRWVHRFDNRLPDVHALGVRRVVWLTRFVPVPLFVQSYFLCLCEVPFWKYFWHSLFAQLLVAACFVTAGASAVKGHWMLLAGALSAIILVTLFIRRYARKPDHLRQNLQR